MSAAAGIVIRQRQVDAAALIEINEPHAVRRIAFQQRIGQHLDELAAG